MSIGILRRCVVVITTVELNQQSLNLHFTQFKILLTVCQSVPMVRPSVNGPGWKESLNVKNKPAGNHMFKVNNRNTRTRYEICSKLAVKTSERRQWCRSGVFIVNFEHISHHALVFLLLTLSK